MPIYPRKNIDEIDVSIFEFIQNYILENGFSPSIREIVEQVDLNSTCSIRYRLQRLMKAGFINYQPGLQRSYHIPGMTVLPSMTPPVVGQPLKKEKHLTHIVLDDETLEPYENFT